MPNPTPPPAPDADTVEIDIAPGVRRICEMGTWFVRGDGYSGESAKGEEELEGEGD